MAITLYAKGVGHLDRAGLGNATDVVARQVDQHDMLGALFGVAHQFHLGRFVQLRRGAAWAGAGQWADGDLDLWRERRRAAPRREGPLGGQRPLLRRGAWGHGLLAHQNLRRGTHHMEVATLPIRTTKVVVIHVRTGVERAQRPVQAQGRLRVAFLNALAHLHLHEVAPGDQLLGTLHRRDVVSLGKVAHGLMALRGFDGWCNHRLRQLGT